MLLAAETGRAAQTKENDLNCAGAHRHSCAAVILQHRVVVVFVEKLVSAAESPWCWQPGGR